jgi:hypothetical protein
MEIMWRIALQKQTPVNVSADFGKLDIIEGVWVHLGGGGWMMDAEVM